ncbi:protein translocase subunit SecF [Candidatus Nanopelagicales bacterium]|nr:protein translocase subunit SecF [Candidatus Nanopelagicales bacterium]
MNIRTLGQRLYQGKISYDFVGKRKTWYTISAVILVITIGSLAFRGLNLGIEFRGGAEFSIPPSACSVEDARDTAESSVGGQAIVTQTGDGSIRIQTGDVSPAKSTEVTQALGQACDVKPSDISVRIVGPTWGADISQKALQGLIVFLVLVTIFLAIYFEFKMAIGALVALAHDLVITIGVFSLLGFEVTPATAIGVLTILGYSLYDTVVVFDKVRENTQGILGQSRLTYSEAANLAVNQTIMRSINTSIVALLPVGAILFVGAGLLGAGTLKDLALALFVGMAAGTYSSIFVATPLLAQLKNREPEVQALERRVYARRRKAEDESGLAEAVAGSTGGQGAAVLLDSRNVNETGSRNQPKKQTRSKRKGGDSGQKQP